MNAKSAKETYFYGVGRRKSSTARAKYYPNSEQATIFVNGKKADEYFPKHFYKGLMETAYAVGLSTGRVEIFVNGGGSTGQSEASKLALAKALVKQDEGYKTVLRMNGLLTTDNRKVLPKRPGKKKARKSEQWSKR